MSAISGSEYCELCGRTRPRDDQHCPNCGQPASSGVHAAPNLDECPYWLLGRWVMPSDFTEVDKAELVRQHEGSE
jgi:hypothetical protein